MDFTSKTVLGLFDASQKVFTIPVYQRAYSWETEHWTAFYNDLKDQILSKNKYFIGNILLETIKKDQHYEVIDGQQRLTTIVLFIHCVLFIMTERQLKPKTGTIASKNRIYINNDGVIKLHPVEYDRPFFNQLIDGRSGPLKAKTPSQKRMKEAITFFSNQLKKEKEEIIVAILAKLEETEITTIELDGKKESALMFELQNNRGKDLTNMEKLKSFFMYQIYCLSTQKETDDNVSSLSTLFEQIYLTINDLKETNEDNVLIYHCQAYINGFSYRNLNDIKDVYKKHKNIKWIMNFVSELHSSFQAMKKLEHCKDYYWVQIQRMNKETPSFVFPFIIKGYKYLSDDTDAMKTLFHLLENLSFRYLLINSRADFRSRLNEILNNLDENTVIEDFINKSKTKINDSEYWTDSRIKEYLELPIYGKGVVNYLLWRYEESLQKKGYSINNINISNESIEHISPQTPTDGEPLASGYEINSSGSYPEDYDQYLHSIGNLVLASQSHNSSLGNHKFSEKLKSFSENPTVIQQIEIKNFISKKGTKPLWDKLAIDRRKEKIVEFSIQNWDMEKI